MMEQEKSHVGMATCFICGEVKHLLLDRRLRNTLVRQACYDKEPCDKCKEYMENGTILISVRDGEEEKQKDNPYRTGGWVVITKEAAERMFGENAPKIAFVEDELWDKIGLPRKA